MVVLIFVPCVHVRGEGVLIILLVNILQVHGYLLVLQPSVSTASTAPEHIQHRCEHSCPNAGHNDEDCRVGPHPVAAHLVAQPGSSAQQGLMCVVRCC